MFSMHNHCRVVCLGEILNVMFDDPLKTEREDPNREAVSSCGNMHRGHVK
jgi:hypothetical protein